MVTLLTALAYAIAKNAGSGAGLESLAQMFGGAAGSSFHVDIQKLRTAFFAITRPDSNRDLDRAAARSSLHASLFCLMEALGESLEPAGGALAKWRQCIEERLPQALRDLRRPPEGFLAAAGRSQLLQAKKHCEAQLDQIETHFTPVDIEPGRM